MVSPALAKGETVSEFSGFDMVTELLDIEAEYAINRSEFENQARDYLKKLTILVNGSLAEANLSGADIDLVILAGGHSQWHFVKEILAEKLDTFGVCGLEKVKSDIGRMIQLI